MLAGPSQITPDMIISLALAGALKDALARVRAYIYLLPRESAILSGRLVIASTGQISAVREREILLKSLNLLWGN